MTATAAYARPQVGGSAVRRAVGRVALVVGAVVAVGVVWTGYKAMGAATGDVWPGTSRALPVPTDDTTLPPFMDILRRFGEPQRTGDSTPLWQYLVDASLFTFREAFVGFLAGIVIGLALAVLLLRSRWLERGLLPWVIVSQTVPLIALAPVIVAWGNQLPFGSWQSWMSVAVIATYLTFFPVTVNALRGLTSPGRQPLELMRSYAASEAAVLRKLRVPNMLPFLFTALKVGATLAFIGALVGEYFGGSSNVLGYVVLSAMSGGGYDVAWAGILIGAVGAMLAYLVISVIEHVAIPWHSSLAGE